MAHQVGAGLDDRELLAPGDEAIGHFGHASQSFSQEERSSGEIIWLRTGRDRFRSPHLLLYYSLKTAMAFPCRILCRASSLSGSCRNWSTFWRIDLTPGLGQSVPQTVLPAISSRRGKYSSS